MSSRWAPRAERRRGRARIAGTVIAVVVASACGARSDPAATLITVSGSDFGAEGKVLRQQIGRFMKLHPDIRVEVQHAPDDATQRHQLYVQWLNARAGDPDVLQIDVIWTPEFAAAGWILPLGRFAPPIDAFFPATVAANTWAGELFALPWFVDVGLLYWRTDLLRREPASLDELVALAQSGMRRSGVRYGVIWQGARYEGLVTVFLEYLGGFGGRMTTEDLRVVVDSPEAVRALTFMRDQIYGFGIAPPEVLTWHEEETRLTFQNGSAVFMRNWPYAYPAMSDSSASRVAGRYAVAPMPAAPGGRSTAALGGYQLAINALSEFPEAAYALIAFLTAPEQMLERAEIAGQYPTRPALYNDPRLARALPIPVEQARRAIASATPRPVIPIYTQLSEILQIRLHRALTRQASPEDALRSAAREMNALIERTRIRELVSRESGRGTRESRLGARRGGGAERRTPNAERRVPPSAERRAPGVRPSAERRVPRSDSRVPRPDSR